MRVAPLVVMAVLMLPVPALSAEKVPPQVIEEVRQLALAAEKKAAKPKAEPTPEAIAAEKKANKSHCEGLFARVAEREVNVPGGCE